MAKDFQILKSGSVFLKKCRLNRRLGLCPATRSRPAQHHRSFFMALARCAALTVPYRSTIRRDLHPFLFAALMSNERWPDDTFPAVFVREDRDKLKWRNKERRPSRGRRSITLSRSLHEACRSHLSAMGCKSAAARRLRSHRLLGRRTAR